MKREREQVDGIEREGWFPRPKEFKRSGFAWFSHFSKSSHDAFIYTGLLVFSGPMPLFDGKWWNEEKTGSLFGGFAVMAGEATRMDGSLKWLIGWGGAAIM